MNPRLRTILGHAAGCCVCSVLVFGIVYAAVVVRFTSEYERQGETAGFLSAASQYTLQVLVFMPELIESSVSLGSHEKVVWSWLNILFDGCVLYFLWSLARGLRRKRH